MLETPFLCPQSFGDDEVMCLWHPSSSILVTKMPLATMLLHILVVATSLLGGSHMGVAAAPEGIQQQQQHPMLVKEPACVTHDHPNTLNELYPNNATGVLNTTLAIVPIPLDEARALIPAEYAILESAYRAILPNFPEGMYPVLVQAGHDHDIRFQNYTIADFSRAGYEFPFVDLLGDGYSSFRWVPEQLIEHDNKDAILGSRAYGTTVHPSRHGSGCQAYEPHPDRPGVTFFNASSTESGGAGGMPMFMSLEFEPSSSSQATTTTATATNNDNMMMPYYPLSFFHNITNQPIFADGATPVCDNMIRLFGTPMSRGEFAPVPVRGSVSSNIGPFGRDTFFDGVFGIQVATPFIENNFLDCNSMKGYQDTWN